MRAVFNGSRFWVSAVDMGGCDHVGGQLLWFSSEGITAGGGGTRFGSEIFLNWPEDFVSQETNFSLSDMILLIYGYAKAEDGRFVIVGPILRERGDPPKIIWQGEGNLTQKKKYRIT